jgi:hypothetical protein
MSVSKNLQIAIQTEPSSASPLQACICGKQSVSRVLAKFVPVSVSYTLKSAKPAARLSGHILALSGRHCDWKSREDAISKGKDFLPGHFRLQMKGGEPSVCRPFQTHDGPGSPQNPLASLPTYN